MPRTRYVLFLLVTCGLSCAPRDNPQVKYDHAYKTLLRGDLKQAQKDAHEACQRYGDPNSEWAWKFRILESRALLQLGRYDDALALLKSLPLPARQPDIAVSILTFEGEADIFEHKFQRAKVSLDNAADLCANSALPHCGYVFKARGLWAGEQNQWESAELALENARDLARRYGDAPLESNALISLSNVSLANEHLDEAIDQAESAHRLASSLDARRFELIAQGNVGWAYYKLGNMDRALQLFEESESLVGKMGDFWTQSNAITNIGYVYFTEEKLDLAAQSFEKALALAKRIKATQYTYNALRALARLSLQTGDLTGADQYAQQALDIARQDNNHLDELYPTLVEGQIAARRGENDKAEATFVQVERDPACPVFLKWEAEHSLARLYESENHADRADREYRAALATFEAARDTVKHEDSQLSFLTNASRIYDDYVHFLVAQKKPDEALRWADYSRAQTLAQGLGLLKKKPGKAGLPENGTFDGPAPSNPRQISRRAGGAIFFYWLGEAQSYLWAIGPREVNLFQLPPRAQIEAAVARYRKSLGGPQNVLGASGQSADPEAVWLYRTLVAPARQFVGKDAKVFIIPDGALNNLNFETLVVDEPNPHFWIEDADVVNASSLRVLEASLARNANSRNKRAGNILLIGDSVAPGPDYPQLPRAADQMKSVAKHFPSGEERIFSREQATPQAYLATKPDQFSYIHFVAHGTASRLSPLDSAIVLSRSPSQPDSFKLYARDIVGHPLRADLVTISACYSAGERAYSGEGLVGLAWAFLRAGAHNVVAGLWEVTDVSTDQLMETFYGEIEDGQRVDVALRDAKLSLLHGNSYRNPYYWAPFQLYTGS